jgi:hypothetical protein
MFIIWSYGKNHDIVAELYPLTCSNCHHITPHGLVREEKKFRLYGIPVAKWASAYQSICAACSHLKPVSQAEAEFYTLVHLQHQPIPTARLDAVLHAEHGRDRTAHAWREAQQLLEADPRRYLNYNTIRSEDQAMAMAGFIIAHLTAELLGVHPYEAYQRFLFTEGGIPALA